MLGSFDLAGGTWDLVIDSRRGSLLPFALYAGTLHLPQSTRIIGFDPDDCTTRPIVEDRLFLNVTALTATDRELYWAETYRDIAVSRIFAKAHGSDAVSQVVETSATVSWLGADSVHLYWAEGRNEFTQNHQLFRIARGR